MSKFFILLGIIAIVFTLIAHLTGFPHITEYMPIDWFINEPEDDQLYKVVPSDEPFPLWLYDVVIGVCFITIGYIFFLKI